MSFSLPRILRVPDSIAVETDSGRFVSHPYVSRDFQGAEVQVDTIVEASGPGPSGLWIFLEGSDAVRSITLTWKETFAPGTRILGDAWERGYGDLEWRGIVPERQLPWYFVATSSQGNVGFGVETGCNALCHWNVDNSCIKLTFHVGSGSMGVQLGDRRLEVATVRMEAGDSSSAFATTKALCRLLCSNPRLPQQPVYGGNDWYYAYGQNSRASILRDSATITELSPGGENRPFMVIDDGWQGSRASGNGGPWNVSSAAFGDMSQVAQEMKALGVRPGLWFRPLLTEANLPANWRFGPRGGVKHLSGNSLDPSIPEVLEFVAQDMNRFRDWGFEMVKHDFSMWDIFAKWGFSYADKPAGRSDWSFNDRTRTSAEIIKELFATLRQSAGDDVMLIGCNTIGHLGAGLFELQRTGDDTSGQEWERTRKMGINTLAFRMPQQGNFFAVDADCVGLTNHVPWELNKQWLDLLARSGTPLFVSADPEALGSEQRAALKEAFALAAVPQPVAEPLDWLDTTCPTEWKLGEETRKYQWSE